MSKKLLRYFPRLNAAYRAFRDSRPGLQTAKPSSMGFLLAGSAAMQDGTFEPTETNLIVSMLAETDLFINIGANVGYYCCLAAKHDIPVIAFEPLPGNLRLLMANVVANGWERDIEVFPMALGERSGIVKIYGGGTGASLIPGWANQTSDQYTWVPISTADQILAGRLEGQRCLILVDVEGVELDVLRGATRVLRNSPKPVWLVEISISEHQPHGVTMNPHLLETFTLFFDAGYTPFTVSQDPREVTLDEVKRVSLDGVDTLGVHNFLFR